MNEQFTQVADNRVPDIEAIISKAMFHTQKEKAHRFLTFIDNYILYYLKQTNAGLNFPILRVPSCPDWAREVFLKYLICRLSIYYNADFLNGFQPSTRISLHYENPLDETAAREARKLNKYKIELNKFKRAIQGLNSKHEYIGESGHKNLIFCASNDLSVPRNSKNKFIQEFYGEADEFSTDKNVFICHNLKASQLIEKIEDRNVNIDNIFIFYTNNATCKSWSKTSIERVNRRTNAGIKNCFIFDFTDSPYRLDETLSRDRRLSFIYPELGEREYRNNKLFTTLNDDEARYLFNHTLEDTGESEHLHIEDDASWHETYFDMLIGNYTDSAEYPIQERNNFSLCLSDSLTEIYKRRLRNSTTDLDENIYDESFSIQKEFAKKVREVVSLRLEGKEVKKIAVVVDYYFPNEMRAELSSLFAPYQAKIYSYSALRPRRNGRTHKLVNSIDDRYVFVLRYRPHNAASAYSYYPNSFDPFTTNPGQHVIEIIQDYVFIDRYLWDKYYYELEVYRHFNSVYREAKLGGISCPTKPNVSHAIGIDDVEEERTAVNGNIRRLRIELGNGQTTSIPETEKVIYRIDNENITDIARLKDLREENLLGNITAVQRLDAITNELSEYLREKNIQNTVIERTTRQAYFERELITRDELDSNVYLWKILLKKKINSSSLRETYDEIMRPMRDSDRIQVGAFRRWTDATNSMVLPRQKRMQKRLVSEYLGLSPAYLAVMRSKKMFEINKSRKNNSMQEDFLGRYLLGNIDNDTFEDFKVMPINEILQFDKMEDLSTLVELLKEKIRLDPVNHIIV